MILDIVQHSADELAHKIVVPQPVFAALRSPTDLLILTEMCNGQLEQGAVSQHPTTGLFGCTQDLVTWTEIVQRSARAGGCTEDLFPTPVYRAVGLHARLADLDRDRADVQLMKGAVSQRLSTGLFVCMQDLLTWTEIVQTFSS